MLRRLLTCLALLTGLAAIGSPVSPALAEAMTGQVGASVVAAQGESEERCQCPSQAAYARECSTSSKRVEVPTRTIRVFVPTVQFGADRAYE